jgi:ribose 5-phosphate isomerase B
MNKNVSIAIGSDHAGFDLKQIVKEYLQENHFDFHDFGTYSPDPSDYPDFAHKVAESVEKGKYTLGIVVCGSGNGVNMVVNKHPGIRSALCWKKEVAHIVRRHNDANICALPGRYINKEEALEIIREFLNTEFEGGRHIRRINKIPYKNDL